MGRMPRVALVRCGAALPLLLCCGLPRTLFAESASRPGASTSSGCLDADGDWYGEGCALGPDCDDGDSAVNPAAVERCDGRDNDCTGIVDDLPGCGAAPGSDAPVDVPGGVFQIGSEVGQGHRDEWPAHPVRLEGFRIDRTEVTNGAYRACVESGSCTPPVQEGSATRSDYFSDGRFDDYPVIQVTWDQARQYCSFLGGRLPTEAEWEASARGQDDRRIYPWGDQEPDCSLANFGGPGGCAGDTDEVGRRPAGASPYGALDMAGNVWEWTSDWYNPLYYWNSPGASPQGPESGSHRVMRGGCWESGIDSLRVSCRNAAEPSSAERNVGFRCAYDR